MYNDICNINYNYYRNKGFVPIIPVDEVFLDINSQIYNSFGYMVSEYGKVYNKIKDFLIKPYINSNGYAYVKLNEHNTAVHRIVLQTFRPILYPENYDVNHIDGNKTRNWLCNLEWATRSENIIHAFDNGLSLKGEDHPNSVYTNEQIEFICKCIKDNISTYEIYKSIPELNYKNLIKLVYKIKHGKAWRHIASKYDIA